MIFRTWSSANLMELKYRRVLLILLPVLLLELMYIYNEWGTHQKSNGQRSSLMRLSFEGKKKEMRTEYDNKKYLKSGATVFDRIYNKPQESIEKLIAEVAAESFPQDWKVDVSIEEFTNFILLVQPPTSLSELPSVDAIVAKLKPILPYTREYLKNVAVFNSTHTCYLFFDEDALKTIMAGRDGGNSFIADVTSKGLMMKRFNSIKIPFQSIGGHMIVKGIISGNSGVVEINMMVDTGASKTVISENIANKTGRDDLSLVRKERFSTANGNILCPIVERSVSVADIERTQGVAVSRSEDNLLGVEFFKGKDYIISNQDNAIYVWQKD